MGEDGVYDEEFHVFFLADFESVSCWASGEYGSVNIGFWSSSAVLYFRPENGASGNLEGAAVMGLAEVLASCGGFHISISESANLAEKDRLVLVLNPHHSPFSPGSIGLLACCY